MIVGTLVTSQV